MSDDLQALNREAIAVAKLHMGQVCWPTVALVAAVWLGVISTLGLFIAGVLNVWIATLLMAALTYMSYTPLHEAAHGNIHGQHDELRWLNDLCGYLVAPFIAVPYASHRLEHFTHHRYTNQPDKDPDFIISAMGNGLAGLTMTPIRFLWVQNTFFVANHWKNATARERVTYCLEVTASLGWRIAILTLVETPGLAWVILLGYYLGGMFTAYWFAYRPHIPYQNAARYQNTNSLVAPRWLKPFEWFWLGQNLHSIHHLFPRVPFYRYHAVHRDIEPILRAQGTPIVGMFDRQPVAEGHGRV